MHTPDVLLCLSKHRAYCAEMWACSALICDTHWLQMDGYAQGTVGRPWHVHAPGGGLASGDQEVAPPSPSDTMFLQQECQNLQCLLHHSHLICVNNKIISTFNVYKIIKPSMYTSSFPSDVSTRLSTPSMYVPKSHLTYPQQDYQHLQRKLHHPLKCMLQHVQQRPF